MTFFLFVPVAKAVTLDYFIIVEENGNSVVIITVHGSGLVTVPLEEDVEEVRVKGALYTINDETIDISIGSTEKAVLLYKTSLLTKKEDGGWSLNSDLINSEKNRITIAMPNNTNILKTEPKALIDSTKFIKLMWEGRITNISVDYFFKTEGLEEFIELEDIHEQEQNNEAVQEIDITYNFLLPGFGLITASSMLTISYFKIKRFNNLKNKQSIMKTLSMNENKVLDVMLQNKSGIKRSRLERISKMAKSSLASTLKNLERKNIVEIDKTYTAHYIRFTKWFNEL